MKGSPAALPRIRFAAAFAPGTRSRIQREAVTSGGSSRAISATGTRRRRRAPISADQTPKPAPCRLRAGAAAARDSRRRDRTCAARQRVPCRSAKDDVLEAAPAGFRARQFEHDRRRDPPRSPIRDAAPAAAPAGRGRIRIRGSTSARTAATARRRSRRASRTTTASPLAKNSRSCSGVRLARRNRGSVSTAKYGSRAANASQRGRGYSTLTR